MNDDEEPVELTTQQALDKLPEKNKIHTFRGIMIPIGADWTRARAVKFIRHHKMELTGKMSTAMGHGMAGRDENGWVFFETKTEKVKK